jgi:hypothetical protein
VIFSSVKSSVPDPDPFPGCLGSGSISYFNEHNKINWRGKFNKEYLLSGSCWTCWQGKSCKMYKKYCFRYCMLPFETVKIRIKVKAGSRSVSEDLDAQHCWKEQTLQSPKKTFVVNNPHYFSYCTIILFWMKQCLLIRTLPGTRYIPTKM